MYLSRLEIENFRGIRSARIDFGETTVLIGENDSGKTTLLEAICLILSPGPEHVTLAFNPKDFFMISGQKGLQPVGPLSIRLTFTERKADEWSFLRKNDLGLSLPDDVTALQEMSLEIRANPSPEGSISDAHWKIAVEGRPQPDYSDDPAVLAWIRRLNPVFRIKSGIFAELPDEYYGPADSSREPFMPRDYTGKLEDNIRQHYQDLVSGTNREGNADLQAGYREALKYLGKISNLFNEESGSLGDIIYEILGRKSPDRENLRKKLFLSHGSAAEKIGLLLFTSAFLQSGSYLADSSAEPIIIIEDPEAHLHPMTLESIKLLIERLKWQKVITTQSGNLLSGFPLEEIRRISRNNGYIRQFRVRPGDLSSEDLRRLSYHVRMRLSTATFARCWLLVEGESEIWMLPHIARLCGYDLSLEGVVCVEFAQCGIPPLIKAADVLGIEWVLLSDGDAAGKAYIETARHFALNKGKNPDDHSMRFREKDIEHHMYFNGYAEVYQEYARISPRASQNMQPRRIIGMAIHRNSKPFMAVAVVEAMARKDSPGVPQQLRNLVEMCIRLAKG